MALVKNSIEFNFKHCDKKWKKGSIFKFEFHLLYFNTHKQLITFKGVCSFNLYNLDLTFAKLNAMKNLLQPI